MSHDDEGTPVMALPEIRQQAARLAGELKSAAGSAVNEEVAGTGGGSRHRGLPEDVRRRLIDVRTALYRRGIHDPLLARFDTATVPQASIGEIAERLSTLAESLSI